jgi:hypothetical protein
VWAQAACDVDKSCVGNALAIDKTSGREAQYVDVDNSAALRGLDVAITVEAWIRPQPQPGKRQFIGGLWGPNKDANDQWTLYLEDNTIVFALSADGTRLGDADNTIARFTLPDLYTRGWVHVAGVWDGASTAARIIVDGVELARATNPQYPISRLHPVGNPALSMQIGSSNVLYDDTTINRTFKGQIDEFRIWSRALTAGEILCQRNRSLDGNESGLALYFRCNDPVSAQNLCDATGAGTVGRMRSGAHCDASDRRVPATYAVTPNAVTEPIYCIGTKTYSFDIVDTSICGSAVRMAITGRDQKMFSLSTTSLSLAPNVRQTFTVTLTANISGSIAADLEVRNANRCGDPVIVPLRLDRSTELSYSPGQLKLDTVFVGCTERPYAEDTLTICNTTTRPMTIRGATFDIDTAFTWRPADPTTPLPITLAPQGCWKVIVKMNAYDTTRTFRDTLRIASDDACPGSGIIPVEGRSQEVLILLDANGRAQLKQLQFEAVCPGQVSNVQLFQYRSLVSAPIGIDTIYFTSPQFFGRRYSYPIGLMPNTAYQPTYIRFRPDRPGPFTGEMHVVTRFRGCTIVRTIALSGRGISVDVVFNANIVDFGSVTVGKTGSQTVSATNRGTDARKMSAYLKVGDVFRISSARSFTIPAAGTQPITLEFRPREPRIYYDTLCLFDEQCYGTICIPIQGGGTFQALSFEPPFLSLDNVIGCRCSTSTVKVKNISSIPVTFNSTLADATGRFTLAPATATTTLQPGTERTFDVTYCPNDLTTDRADGAYIDLKLTNGELYQILVRGTSVVPKLLVPPLTAFGAVEVGWWKRDSVLVENISPIPVRVDAIALPPGYTLLGTSRALPAMLAPRDSIWAQVEFRPTAGGTYNGTMVVTSSDPCAITGTGAITGRGVIVKLDVPINFINHGQIKPCDCDVREIPLPNGSAYIPISIDSIWIDGAGVPNPRPAVFMWKSRQTGGTSTPYAIAPGTMDTLLVSFCPNIPAVNANRQSNAVIHIKASTPGWSEEFRTTLRGLREMNFQPNKVLVSFGYTRVDRDTAITAEISVPDEFTNPSGDSVVITGIGFLPDQRVFTAAATSGQPLPWTIRRGEKFRIDIHFRPRAPRAYTARLQLYTGFPCAGVDTSILVTGEGFAPPAGLQMAFNTARVGSETYNLNTCDTLDLPIMIDRAIPQDVIDILFRVGYDTNALRLIDIRSPYTTIASVIDTGDGARAVLKDARYVAGGEIARIRFSCVGIPARFPITLDSIGFDSDSLVNYKIIPETDSGSVVIEQPMIEITPVTSFDTVNMKSCADRQIIVRNPGAIPIRFDSLTGLPPGHRITSSDRALPAILAPGESVTLTITFCPFIEARYDTTVTAWSTDPCDIVATGSLGSFGYAPPFPMRLLLVEPTLGLDTIRGAIADTVEVPVFVDRDIPQTPLDVGFHLRYNRRAMQYLDIRSAYSTSATAFETKTGLDIAIPGCDSIVKGEIARLRFIVSVPDSVVSTMVLEAAQGDFASDSVFWVKLIPSGDADQVVVDPKCNITRLEFRGGSSKLSAPIPNPARELVTMEAEFTEDARAVLRVFDASGMEVARPLDEQMSGGRYRLEIETAALASGSYFVQFSAGRFSAIQRFTVSH